MVNANSKRLTMIKLTTIFLVLGICAISLVVADEFGGNTFIGGRTKRTVELIGGTH